MSELNEVMKKMFVKELEFQNDTSIMKRIAENVAELREEVVDLKRINDLEESLWDE